MALRDDCHEVFEHVIKWLYRSVLMPSSLLGNWIYPRCSTDEDTQHKMVDMIIVADRYSLDELSDCIMSSFASAEFSFENLMSITRRIVDNTTTRCKARDSLARKWAWHIHQKSLRTSYNPNGSNLDCFAHDPHFFIQVTNEHRNIIFQKSSVRPSARRSVCDYHLHDKSMPCKEAYLDYYPNPIAIVVRIPALQGNDSEAPRKKLRSI